MTNYNPYIKAIQGFLEDDNLFESFRRDKRYRTILEHCSFEQGQQYLEEAHKDNPFLFLDLNEFADSEDIGMPMVYEYYKEQLSPTTCRYIKVLSDLIKLHGSLDGMNIVEIGVGYGGQCKIIHDTFKPKSYTIIDLPEVMMLAEKYLEYYEIKPIFRYAGDTSNIPYDLCISNYAFTEIDRCFQDDYAEHIIKNSECGYMTCNFMDNAQKDGRFTKEQIIALKGNYTIMEEKPLTASDNFIYTWQ